MTMRSRKSFSFEANVGQDPKLRVLVPNAATKYMPAEHFMAHEESDYLGHVLNGVPYATYKTDDPVEMENLLQNGYIDKSKRKWVDAFAYWKDQEGHAVLVPENAGITSL
jgi:hypothetical protein